MRKRKIGSLDVTVVGIGCNNFGRQLDAEATRRVVWAALDQGINFFDTADHYGRPRTTSEVLLGRALGARRHEAVIATKFGRVLDETRQGAKPAYVKAATEDALRRLNTDVIDLMQLHIPDETTPIEDTLGALSDLVAEGKIREIGASNFNVSQLREAAVAAHDNGTQGFVSTQCELSLLQRAAETTVLAECSHLGMAFLPYLPLFNGLLSGKYRPGEPAPSGSRISTKNPELQTQIFSDRNMSIVAELTVFAESRGHSVLELAFAWLLSHAVIPSVIAGVSSPAQVAGNVMASRWELTAEEIAEVGRIAEPEGLPA